MNWKHDQLLRDLSAHLKLTGDRVVWEDMQLGPSGSPRPDVYVIPKSYTRFCPLAYEIKISVADFRRDVTAGKWQSYLKFSSGVIFAVPQGLINKADVPATCGLIVRTESGWRNVKGPTLSPVNDLPRTLWQKLVIDGIERAQTPPYEARQLNTYLVHQKIRQKYGEELALLLSNRDRAEDMLEYAAERHRAELEAMRERYSKEIQSLRDNHALERSKVDAVRAEMAQALGLPADANIYSIAQAGRDALKQINADERIKALHESYGRMKRNLQWALKELDTDTSGFFQSALNGSSGEPLEIQHGR